MLEHIPIAGYTGNMKPSQQSLLSTHLGAKAHGNQGFSAVVDGVAEWFIKYPVGTGFEMRRKIFPALVFRRFCGMLE